MLEYRWAGVIIMFNTGHAATAAIAVIGTLVAVRGPWTTSASAPAPQPAVYVDQYGRTLQAVPQTAVPAMNLAPAPATYAAPRVTRVVTQPMSAPAYETVAAPARTTRPAPVVERASTSTGTVQVEQPRRSWKKRALVIGGSAGAGAGIGALAGGKKGALIGAAIGGGSAAVFEALKK
jgi:hypothetical protein